MSKSNIMLKSELTEKFLSSVITSFSNEEVLRIGSGIIAIPTLDSEGNERWVKISVIIPKSEIENGDFDGYGLAEDYQNKLTEKAEKARIAAEKKTKKIAEDARKRAEKSKKKTNAEETE